MKWGPPWRIIIVLHCIASAHHHCPNCSLAWDAHGHSQCASRGSHHNFTHNDPAFSVWMAKCKISLMEIVKCKIGCIRKSVQIQCVHYESIIAKKSLLLIRSLTRGKFSLKVAAHKFGFQYISSSELGSKSWMQTQTKTEMPKWRWCPSEAQRTLQALRMARPEFFLRLSGLKEIVFSRSGQ